MLFLLALLLNSPHGFSDETPIYLPEFRAYQDEHPGVFSPNEFNTRETVRVLIFPHLGTYSQPQGRETKIDEVSFRGKDNCSLYSDPALTQLIREDRFFTFRYDDVALKGLFLKCDKRTTLVREKGLPSFDYQGVFAIRGFRQRSGEKYVRVVQILPFENYLKGVVPAEMPYSWPEEALRAQTIAARSYAVFQIRVEESEIASRDYDLDDTIFYQAYLGVSWQRGSTDKAVDDTAGQVLTYNHRPIPAFFSADSGGYTEIGENVWKIPCPFCVSQPEAYDLNLVQSEWVVSVDLDEIEARLRATGSYTGSAALTAVEIPADKINQSGRVMSVKLRFSDGKILNLFGPTFQRVLRMRSNLFTIREVTSDNGSKQLQFVGRGYGHGVGMNQWGARVLAQNYGWDHRQILFFYYQNVALE